MGKNLTLQYWRDEALYVGKIKEFPGIYTQGKTLEILEENILRAYYTVFPEKKEEQAPEIFFDEIE